jgi:hypothetical protein
VPDWSVIVEDGPGESAEPVRVGQDVHLHDLPIDDREAHPAVGLPSGTVTTPAAPLTRAGRL